MLHQGDFGYGAGFTSWKNKVEATLDNPTIGYTFPYLGSDGNHDDWVGEGYRDWFRDRVNAIGAEEKDFSGIDTGNYSVSYRGLKMVFVREPGNDPPFISQSLSSDTHIWKICSWHQTMSTLTAGNHGDAAQSYAPYDACRTWGAIIANGHNHNYSRTKTMTNFGGTGGPKVADPQVDLTQHPKDGNGIPQYPNNLLVAPGKTFVVVEGAGGAGLYAQTWCDLMYPYGTPLAGSGLSTNLGCDRYVFASMYTPRQVTLLNADGKNRDGHGVLFITFNVGGNPYRAQGYFKDVRGEVIDTFTITASSVPTTPGPSATPTKTPTPTRTPTPTLTRTPTPTPTSAPGNRIEILFLPTDEDIANPERGFMRQSNIDVDKPLDPSKIGKVQATDTVDWVYFRLENYRDPRDGKGLTLPDYQGKLLEPLCEPLDLLCPKVGLNTVKDTFDEARKKGLKLVIRFKYVGYPGIGSTQDFANAEPDAPLTLALQHINQLAPVINANKDVIAAVQAGMVGYWGEWHSSKYLSSLENRKAIVDEWLTAVSKDRMIQMRYPKYVQKFYGGPLSVAQSFDQSDLSRIGFHDDALFKDTNDDGTFTSNAMGMKISTYCDGSANTIQCWRDYFYQTGRFTPIGGEAGTHSSTPSPEADCANAVPEMGRLHFSFLHNGYSMVTLNHWINQGCMPEIRNRLGYRLALNKAYVPQSVQSGNTMNLEVQLSNVGFASLYNPRPVIAVLANASNRYEIPLPTIDPRRWEAGQNQTLNINAPIASTIVPGTYTLGLWLPDASTTLKNRPEYAVRFANLNVWDPSSGVNIVTSNFVVNPASTTPSLTPVPGDIDGNGSIDLSDLTTLLTDFGKSGSDLPGDIDHNGSIDLSDLVTLLSNFGR